MKDKALTLEEALELVRKLYALDPEDRPLARAFRNILAGFDSALDEVERAGLVST